MKNKELIRRSKKLLTGEEKEIFTSVSKVYPMTTENIKQTYENFDLKDKKILTVASSGDHILCAALQGAGQIDSFDINVLAKYYYYLKKAIIETYDFKDFKDILLYNIIPIGKIEKSWYDEFKTNIPNQYREFWDNIIEYSINENLPLDALFFATPNYFPLVNYLKEENFEKLKEILPNIPVNFIQSDLVYLDKKLDDEYDYMFLSNIADYIGIDKAKKIAETKLMGHLKEGGQIAYAYMYDAPLSKVKRFDYSEYYQVDPTTSKTENKDCVLTLKKH